ncbi:MAG: PAS domain S-box protein [Acidobacteria bacterium]|nr:PAS domain S-box protein [Acidobacteriota bacterium]
MTQGTNGDDAHVPPDLTRRHQLQQALIEASATIIYAKDLQGSYLLVNRQWEMLVHIPREQALGKTVFDLYPPETARILDAHDKAALGAGFPLSSEETLHLEDGPHTYLSIKFPIYGGDGAAYAVGGISTDISARKRAEEALRKSEDQLRLLLDSVKDFAIFRLDAEGRVATWNAGAERIKGYRAEEILGKDFSSFYTPEDRKSGKPADQLRQAAVEGRYEEESWRVRKDGSRYWASAVLTAVRGADGELQGFAKVVRDISEQRRAQEALRTEEILKAEIAERKRAEEKLQQSQEHYRALIENGSEIIGLLDADGIIRYVSPGASRILGPPPEDAIGKSALEFVHPDDLPDFKTFFERDIRIRSEAVMIEFRYRHQDGSWRILELLGKNMLHNPAVKGIVVNARDVTERRRAEEELRQKEKALQQSRDQLRALAARLLTAEEEERRRVSRELHDDLNQKLAVLAFEVESFSLRPAADMEYSRESLQKLQRQITELSDDVRRMAHQIHPSVLDDLGLEPALRSYCSDFSKREGMDIKFSSRHLPANLRADVSLCLYRVAQECLRNAARHAHTRVAAVTLAGYQRGICLRVRDFGVGFDPALAKSKGGLGILSMQERVRLVNGVILVKSSLDHGTTVDARIPLRQAPNKARNNTARR